MNSRLLTVLSAVFLLAWALVNPAGATPSEEMADAAKSFLNALSPEQRSKVLFDFNSDERFNWDFVPKMRKGIPLKELDPSQQELARNLLRSGLSPQGYSKATNIIYVIESVLREMENQSPRRDSGLYYVSLFGTPEKPVWGWRVEGHHLSANFTIRTNEVLAFSPSFFGSNPAEVRSGPRKGLRVLAAEEDLGRQLAASLSPDQRKVAMISETAPREIITGRARKATALEPRGIPGERLNASQLALLKKLVREHLFRLRNEVAERDFERIEKAGWEKVSFAWAGPLQVHEAHYYRVQGSTFLLEYDNTQNEANHVHTVWRDLENDFGEDILRRHYDETPHVH